MLTTILAPAVLLLASAVHAQSPTPSVTSEEVFTIQTSVPGSLASIPGSMGIPPGETPIIASSLISQSIFTNPLRTTESASLTTSTPGASTPGGTPVTTGIQVSRPGNPPPAQQSTAAAPSLNGNGNSFAFALVGAAAALL